MNVGCMVKKFLWILTVGLLSAGCSEKPQFTAEQLAAMPLARRDGLPDASGGFALVVGEQSITADEVVGPVFEKLAQTAQRNNFERFRQIAEPIIEERLVDRISDAILYSRAKKEAGENIKDELDRVTTAEVRKFVMNFGGDYARAEEALKQMGMDWEKFEQYKRRLVLSQSYIAQQFPDQDQPVTYSEMIVVYDNIKDKVYTTPASLQFRLIDIEPAKFQPADANKPRDEQAREIAYSIVNRINAGDTFEQLAKELPQWSRASEGGLWRKLDPESLAAPYDVLATRAATMKPGEVAGPIEAGGHIFIMQLVEYQPDRMRPAIEKLNNELLQQASAADRARFVDFCVREIYRMANK
jgi:hypothetical protein